MFAANNLESEEAAGGISNTVTVLLVGKLFHLMCCASDLMYESLATFVHCTIGDTNFFLKVKRPCFSN